MMYLFAGSMVNVKGDAQLPEAIVNQRVVFVNDRLRGGVFF